MLPELVFGKDGRKHCPASPGQGFQPAGTSVGEDTVLLTVKQTAELLGVCGATVYAMVERGDLEHVRVSNSIRIVVKSRDRTREGLEE